MKFNRNRIVLSLCAALLLCIAHPALALWRMADVTANGVYDGKRFTVKITDREQFKEFEITLTPQPDEISPFLTGQLSLISKNEWVASVPVSESRDKGVVTYRFRVTSDAIALSSFEIHASFFAPARGRSPFAKAMLNKKKVEQVMGGTIYAIKLKAFASPVAH